MITVNANVTFDVVSLTDTGTSVQGLISFPGSPSVQIPITVWRDSDYIAAGQWTDASAKAQIESLLAQGSGG